MKSRMFSEREGVNLAEVLSKVAVPPSVLLIQYLDGGESIRFNPFQVIWLSLKLNGQGLRGRTEGTGIPPALLPCAAPSPALDFVPHPESCGMVLSFRVFLGALYRLSVRN